MCSVAIATANYDVSRVNAPPKAVWRRSIDVTKLKEEALGSTLCLVPILKQLRHLALSFVSQHHKSTTNTEKANKKNHSSTNHYIPSIKVQPKHKGWDYPKCKREKH